MKRQKDQQKFIDSLKEGMEVVTSAGIIGRITKIDGAIVRLMVDEKTFIRVAKSSIQGEFKG
jgi:preprotein translocase YajC subunit